MSDQLVPADITLTAIAEPDFFVLRELAGTIWRQHYAEIVSAAQIEYMLSGRFSDESLREYIRPADRCLEVLRVSGTPVGYCGYERSGIGVSESDLTTVKLGQLYVLESRRGMGLGRFMLRHVEQRARDLGSVALWLQVNKRNTGSIAFYMAMGFAVAREAVFDIGGGFVMDDYLMTKRLS